MRGGCQLLPTRGIEREDCDDCRVAPASPCHGLSGYREQVRGWTWWFGLFLGGLLVAAGVAETVRVVRSGDGGLVFWFDTLVGGGILVLIGTLLLPRRPIPGCVLTTAGCLAGVIPTIWALIVPVMLVALVIASAKQAAAATDKETRPG
jgi:hypothetical protein